MSDDDAVVTFWFWFWFSAVLILLVIGAAMGVIRFVHWVWNW